MKLQDRREWGQKSEFWIRLYINDKINKYTIALFKDFCHLTQSQISKLIRFERIIFIYKDF